VGSNRAADVHNLMETDSMGHLSPGELLDDRPSPHLGWHVDSAKGLTFYAMIEGREWTMSGRYG
jgi:hypothetical protein